MKFTLVETCYACPEQYDVYLDKKKVGYMRLRHGAFECRHLGPEGGIVYREYPNGDGRFDYDERDYYITLALEALRKHIQRDGGMTYEIVEEYDEYNDEIWNW